MALSIKTEEADRLARRLALLTGETMTEAVTQSMRERLERLERLHKERPRKKGELAARILTTAAEIRKKYNLRPVTKEEWDELWGEGQSGA
jgi:antitoxin VapB